MPSGAAPRGSGRRSAGSVQAHPAHLAHGPSWVRDQPCVMYHLPLILRALKFDTTSAASAGSVVTLSKDALSPVTVAPLIFRPLKAAPSSLIWSSIGVIDVPQAEAAPGMLEIALPPQAISSQTARPLPATMAPSQEVSAASGVVWAPGPAAEEVLGPADVAGLAGLLLPVLGSLPESSVVPDHM